MSAPKFASLLSSQIQTNNFIAIQSAQLSVTYTSSTPITFTLLEGVQRITAKITNSGSKGCYLASGVSGLTTAVVSSSTPTPAASVANAVATCDFIAPGSILTQDYVAGTTTFAAITAGSDVTTLEISIGYGQ